MNKYRKGGTKVINQVITGLDLKKLVKDIPDKALVVVGTLGDDLGRDDRQIIGVERRNIGFDTYSPYYVLCVNNYTENGCLRFYRN